MRVTDFHIYVHSSYTTSKEKGYIVTIHNPTTSDKLTKIEWINTSSNKKLSEFLHKKGNFHFFGSDMVVSLFHSLVASQKVPEIETVDRYGWTPDGNICLFPNGIYNKKDKVFYDTNSDGSVLYLPGGNGILPVDQQ